MGHFLRTRSILLVAALAWMAPNSSNATLYNLGAFWKQPAGGTDNLAFTTSAFTGLTTWTCTGPVTVQSQTGGAAKTVVSNTTVNLTGPSGVHFFSDSSCTQEVTSATINSGASSTSFYFLSGKLSATLILSAAASSYTTGTQNQMVSAYLGCTWLGGTAGNVTTWETATNWSCGHMPTSAVGDIAVFDTNCGSNCVPNLPTSDQYFYGLYLTRDYSGTVRMTNSSVEVEAGGGFRMEGGTYFQPTTDLFDYGPFTQTGGTFIGGSGQLLFEQSVTISGGSITLSSDSTFADTTWSVTGSATVDPNSGTLVLEPSNLTSISINPGTIHYNNVEIYPSQTGIDFGGSTFYIDGDFTFGDSGPSPLGLNNVIFSVGGNVTSDTGGENGTAQLVFRGADPVWDAAPLTINYFTGNVTVNVSGTLTLSQKLNLTAAGQKMNVTSGAIDMNNYNLTINSSLTLAPGTSITRGTGVLKVGGATIGAGSYSGGTIN